MRRRSVTLPDDVFDLIERLRQLSVNSRSGVIRQLVRRYGPQEVKRLELNRRIQQNELELMNDYEDLAKARKERAGGK